MQEANEAEEGEERATIAGAGDCRKLSIRKWDMLCFVKDNGESNISALAVRANIREDAALASGVKTPEQDEELMSELKLRPPKVSEE